MKNCPVPLTITSRRVSSCSLPVGVFLALSLFLSASCIAQADEQGRALKEFLLKYAGKPWPEFEKENKTRYSAAFVDLAGSGKQQVIVYLTGRAWCGSGGCLTLILSQTNLSFELITKITISRPPICILATRSQGWSDIALQVGGGGLVAHEVRLSFNGKTYPSNPSVPPATSLGENVPGKVVIPYEEQGAPLYE